MRPVYQMLSAAVVLALVLSASAGAAPPTRSRDVCIAAPTGGGPTSLNVFILRNVETVSRGRSVAVNGLYYSTGSTRVSPLHGSAIMGSDGTVRIGFFVHSSAESINDFTVAGVTNMDFEGTLSFDSDGDFKPNGTLVMSVVGCDTLTIP